MTLQEFITALAGLRNLPPLERAEQARTLIDEAKAVLSLERALAIAQARQETTGAEIGRRLGVTAQAVGKSDRLLLRRALEVLSRPGTTLVSRQQTMQGLVDGAGLDVMARRVVHGARNLNRDSISADEQGLIEAAAARAAALTAETVSGSTMINGNGWRRLHDDVPFEVLVVPARSWTAQWRYDGNTCAVVAGGVNVVGTARSGATSTARTRLGDETIEVRIRRASE